MFRNMEYVYCVYKERSFSKAAEKLHIAQPSLSAMIRKEEEQAGAPIFERKTRPVSLTPFGIEFIRGIEQIYELENHLHDMADELRTLQSGIVSIGGSNLGSDYIVPERIAAFKTKYPNVTLRASEASTIQCKQMLDAGDLDLVITNRPLDTESYERIVCYRENLLLAVPSHFAVNEGLRNYQLTQAERGEMIFLLPEERCAPLEYFYDTPFILLHDGNYLRLCCERMFEENHFQPRLVMEMDRSMVAYNFARYGLGAAFISNVLVEHQPDDGSLVFYKPRSRHAVRDAYICYKKGRFVTSAMRGFIEMMVRK